MLAAVAVALALVSGLLHASWNALAKRTRLERGATLATLTIALLVGAIALGVLPWRAFPIAALGWTVVAGLGEAAYVTALGIAYARGDLALTYAVTRASALVFVWPASFVAFGTVPAPLEIAATVLVALGVSLCRASTPGSGRVALGWALATGAAIAVYHTGYAGAVRAGADAVPAFVVAIAIAMPILWATIGGPARADAVKVIRTPVILAAGTLCAGSFILLVVALESASSGPMLGVRNASVGFAVLFALALGERPSRRQWGGIALLGVGIATFALAEHR